MRILVLNYEFPPVGGGGGRVAEDVCRELAARQHEVLVLTSHAPDLLRRERRDGFEIRRIPALRRRRDTCSPLEMGCFVLLGSLPTLYEAMCWRPDLIHVHFAVPTGPLAWLVRKLLGIPYVLTAHLGDVPGGVPEQTDSMFALLKPFTIPIWKSASAVTAVSEFTRRLAVAAYGVPVETVHNGVVIEPFFNRYQPNPMRRLVFAGRFSVQKNVLFLADLLARARDLPWTMEMLGDGPLRSEFETRIRRAGLVDRVQLRGWVSSEEVDKVMAASDVLLLPSLSEGFSVVGVRALSLGLAILASDIGGNTDLVRQGENGFLCSTNNLDAFADALRHVLADDERLGAMQRASRSLSLGFELCRIVNRYEDIFAHVRKHSVA